MTSELRNKLVELFGEALFPEIFNLLNASSKDGSFVVHGRVDKPEVLYPAAGLMIAPKERRQAWYVASPGGAQTMTADPQISAGTFVGQEVLLIGTSDVDVPKFTHGNGLNLNGSVELSAGQVCLLFWNGSEWAESARR